MLGAFTVGFQKVYKSYLLLLVALPGLIDTLLHSCNVLNTEIFPQHTIADLISRITFIVLFSQEKPLWLKEVNTHIAAK